MARYRSLYCDDEERRALLQNQSALNGIDYIEIDDATTSLDKQRFLHVYFVNSPPPVDLEKQPSLFQVEGGERIRNIRVQSVTRKKSPSGAEYLEVEVDRAGDFSNHCLIIDSDKLDPPYARCEFSFKAGCPNPFDCQAREVSFLVSRAVPTIEYLAKDYASFRQALLDLIAKQVPDWQEQNPADLGIALVELLAYVGDQLSYYQDAVANEATLETARQRISVRRHARLIDYAMHDGVSARTFLHFRVTTPGTIPPGTQILTRITRPLGATVPGKIIDVDRSDKATELADATFETLVDLRAHQSLDDVPIYTWGNKECCLPKGVFTLDLQGDLAFDVIKDGPQGVRGEDWRLKPGDFLLLEEIKGPSTGNKVDADPEHRQVVRLTDVKKTHDTLKNVALTRVTWDQADALTFPLCLSVRLQGKDVEDISLAQGNLVLADHGRKLEDEYHPMDSSGTHAKGIQVTSRPYRFHLQSGPLSFHAPLPKPKASAQSLHTIDPRKAIPQIIMRSGTQFGSWPDTWKPALPNLLYSGRFDRHFAVETDNDGRAQLRFGDNQYGLAPMEGSYFQITYRVGVGSAGNIGAEALAHVVQPKNLSGWPGIEAVRNPLPAWGGTDPETLQQVKRLAPAACHAEQFRAVTEQDYAAVAAQHPAVSKAVATFRWTGSWHTVFLTIDPKGSTELSRGQAAQVRAWVQRFTQTGYDLEISRPIYVPLEIEADICVALSHFRAHVLEALLTELSNRDLGNRGQGFFHPDNFSFAEPVYLSALYSAMEAVEGVDSVDIKAFKRFDKEPAGELEQGYIPMGRLEVARLDNDPNFPERGVLRLNMVGGK
jgi:hypothetical protein